MKSAIELCAGVAACAILLVYACGGAILAAILLDKVFDYDRFQMGFTIGVLFAALPYALNQLIKIGLGEDHDK